jgi:hypothetical protein
MVKREVVDNKGLVTQIDDLNEKPLIIDGREGFQWCDLKSKPCYDSYRTKCQYYRILYLK